MKKTKLKNRYHVEILDSEYVFLMTEAGHYVLKGGVFIKMLPLLDGSHTAQEIVSALRNEFSPMQVMYALTHLSKQGYITEPVNAMPDSIAAYWESFGVSAREAAERLGAMKVSISALGDTLQAQDEFVTLLDEHGILHTDGDDADFSVVFVDDYLQAGLRDINERALKTGRPWMLVKPVGATLWIGPIFKPGETACWQCLHNRLHGNREIEAFLERNKGIQGPFPVSRAVFPAAYRTALTMALTELSKYIVKPGDHPLLGNVMTYDTLNSEHITHRLVQRPQCPVCGDPHYRTCPHPDPVELQSRIKHFTIDGGHRTLTPAEMLEKYEHHISAITGVISSVSPVIEVRNVVYIYGAMHNFALNYIRWEDLRKSLRWRSGGKGLAREQSRASAIGESLERYSGIMQGYEYRTQATYNELYARGQAIHPNDCMLFSDEQYAERDVINNLDFRFHFIPVPLDPDEKIDWTPVWSLTNENFNYIPTSYCYYNYWPATRYKTSFCWADSNGNASGNTLEEATLQALMELVERDAVGIWWYNRLQRPEIDIESFNDPRFNAVRDHYASINRDVWLLDISSDLDIPTVAAISRRNDGVGDQVLLGYGTHFDPKIAASRALTEMSELLGSLSIEYGAHEDPLEFDDPNMTSWMKTATVEEQWYLKPNPNLPVRTYDSFTQQWNDDLKDDIQLCVDLLREKNLEVFMLDQTRPDIELNVVKMFVPGLRHFWSRLARGRLYDVPVEQGWLEEPTHEDDLNPIPMFF